MARRRYSGQRVAPMLVLGLGVVLSAALVAWQTLKTPRGSILAWTAVDGSNVVVLRRGFEKRKTVHLQLLDLSQKSSVQWSVALFGVQSETFPIVANGLVVVRSLGARGDPQTQAFDLDDGSFRWRAARPREVPKARASDSSRGCVRRVWDGVLYELYDTSPPELIAVSLVGDGDEGSELWRTRLPERARLVADTQGPPMVFAPDGSLFRVKEHPRVQGSGSRGALELVAPRSMDTARLSTMSWCVTGETVAYLDAAGVVRWVSPVGAFSSPAGQGQLVGCGTRSSTLVALIDHRATRRLVTLADQSVRTLSLGETDVPGQRVHLSPKMPRYISVPTGSRAIAVVDLDSLRVYARREFHRGPVRVTWTGDGSLASAPTQLLRIRGKDGHVRGIERPFLAPRRFPIRSDLIQGERLFTLLDGEMARIDIRSLSVEPKPRADQ